MKKLIKAGLVMSAVVVTTSATAAPAGNPPSGWCPVYLVGTPITIMYAPCR